MKTLFISDLDGTLLNKDAALSDYSINGINSLILKGMNFTFATARSPWSVQNILKPLNITIPAVLMNGVCIYDLNNSRFIRTEGLNRSITDELFPIIHEYKLSGFLYMIDNDKIVVYYESITTPHALAFMQERIRQFGKIYVQTDCLPEHNFGSLTTVYYTVSDRIEVLTPFYERVKHIQGLRAEFYRDVYNRDLWFLEILSENASKGGAVDFIKRAYDFDRIIAFGDNINDLPLFSSADYCLAVENAHDEIKSKADEIIKSNTEDGVVRWLEDNYFKYV